MRYFATSSVFSAFLMLVAATAITACSSSDNNADPDDDGLNEVTWLVTVEAGDGGSVNLQELRLANDEPAQIELLPEPGNEVVSVSGCDGALDGNQFDIVGQSIDCTLFVQFGTAGETLIIDIFGEGDILVDTQRLCTARDTCELSYPRNSTLTLRPEPAPGWQFERWSNCPSVDNDLCTLTMSETQSVYPSFTRIGDVILNSDVILLEEAQLDSIVAIDEASITFSETTPELNSFKVNSILISQRNEGFARRVTRVLRLSGTPALVQTQEVYLSDIVTQGTLISDATSSNNQNLTFEPAPGVTVLETTLRSINASIRFETTLTDASGNATPTRLSGQVGFELNPEVFFDFIPWGVEEVRLIVAGSIRSSLSVGLTGGTGGAFPTRRIGKVVGAPLLIGPIVVVPEYNLFVTTEVNGSVSLEVKTSMSAGGTFGYHYRRGSGLRKIASLSASGTMPIADAPKFELELSMWEGTETRMMIYGVAGPSVKIGPVVGMRAVIPLAGEAIGCTEIAAFIAAQGEISGSLNLILRRVETPAFRYRSPALDVSITTPINQPRCEESSNGAPQNLTAQLLPDNTVSLSWEPPTGTPLYQYVVYRNNTVLDTAWGTTYVDETTKASSEYCYSVQAFDEQGRTFTRSESTCLTTLQEADLTPPSAPDGLHILSATTASLELDWQDSTDDRGGEIVYLVYSQGRIIAGAVDSEITLTQLLPDTQYCFEVVALDANDNVSSASAEVCGLTQPDNSGAWRMRIACTDRSVYAIENRLDLLASTDNNIVNLAGEGTDYNGSGIAYILNGQIELESGNFEGQINYTFDLIPEVRVDAFSVDLSSEDTGDVVMQQIQVTGCTTTIRFDRLEPNATLYPVDSNKRSTSTISTHSALSQF